MKIFPVTALLAFGLAFKSLMADGVCATEHCTNAKKIHGLPADVQSFVERRDGCDHFRGEPTDFDEAYLKRSGEDGLREQRERADFVFKEIAELCTGTDTELSALKARYADVPVIFGLLSAYESNIEIG